MLESASVCLSILRRDNGLSQLAPDGLFPRPTKNGFGTPIPIKNVPPMVHADDGVKGGVDDAANTFFTLPQRDFGLETLGGL
jgi:hypothetical protein